jgi:3-dehydroquinate synthase
MSASDISIEGSGGAVSRISFGSLQGLGESLDLAKTVIVTDRLIRKIHGTSFPSCPVIEVERGEAAKSLSSLELLYGAFLDAGLGRDGLVLAIGGGTVSDLAGFAASTWLRGIGFGFAPTTLLSMVDASVGGKNGVDFRGVKNLIGTFCQPRFVRIDVSMLDTLSDLEFASGMAEVIKHAVITGGEYFELVARAAIAASGANAAGARPTADILERIVSGSVEIKAAVVRRDEKEAGERRVLNLGHTAGHGIEAATALPHGHSVASGLGTACRLARKRGLLAAADCDRITRLIEAWGLPSTIAAAAGLAGLEDGPELRRAIGGAVAADKKRSGGDILMALPQAAGKVVIEAVALADLQSFIMEAP